MKPRAAATHCKRGHPFTTDSTLPNPVYVVVDGVRTNVMYRTCRTCRDLRAAEYTRPERPSPQPVRAIEDEHERFLEQIIRRVTRAPVADRLYQIRSAVKDEFDWPGPGSIRHPALPFGENYWEYQDRVGGEGSFEQWLLSRIFSDPRIQKELLRPDLIVHDPLLRAEMIRAQRARAAELQTRENLGAGPAVILPFPPPPQ